MNREEWLTKAALLIQQELGLGGGECGISVGFPSKMGLSTVNRRVGECWQGTASEDGVAQVFISPVLDDPVGTVAHELVHVELPEAKHGPEFAKRVKELKFEGKPTECTPEGEVLARLNEVLAPLGKYPHAQLTPSSTEKKQTTRLLKAECPSHGYVVRVTKKWVEELGPPLCPCKQAMEVEMPEEEDEG